MCGAGAQGRKGSLNFSRHVIGADGGMSFGGGGDTQAEMSKRTLELEAGLWMSQHSHERDGVLPVPSFLGHAQTHPFLGPRPMPSWDIGEGFG